MVCVVRRSRLRDEAREARSVCHAPCARRCAGAFSAPAGLLLVVLLNEVRAASLTWLRFKAYVLRPLNADLALCPAAPSAARPANEDHAAALFYRRAKWTMREFDDWGDAIDEVVADPRTTLPAVGLALRAARAPLLARAGRRLATGWAACAARRRAREASSCTPRDSSSCSCLLLAASCLLLAALPAACCFLPAACCSSCVLAS